jgi:succinoglycan biosynthesis protein ExoO
MTIAAVIPLHNKARFVERALASALAQDAPPDEIIVVDDASTDGGMEIVRRCARARPAQRFTFLSRASPGPGGYAARNAAIAATEAEWIAFLDADDAWHSDYIATVRQLLAQADPSVGCVFTSRRFVRVNGSVFVQTALSPGAAQPALLDFDAFLRLWRTLDRCPMWTSASVVRRDVLARAGMFPAGRCKRGGDKETWLRVMAVTNALASPFVGATYHNDVPDQVTRSVSVNHRHCLCDTLAPLIATSAGERQKLLKWIYNSEIQKYARWLFGKHRIAPDVYRGFYAREAPATYVALRMMSLTPLPVQRALRDAVKRRAQPVNPSAPPAPSD